jgi:hypothetical protein
VLATIAVIVAALQTLYTLIVFDTAARGTSFCPDSPPVGIAVATAGACLAAAAVVVFALMPRLRRVVAAAGLQIACLGAWFALGGWHEVDCAIQLGLAPAAAEAVAGGGDGAQVGLVVVGRPDAAGLDVPDLRAR